MGGNAAAAVHALAGDGGAEEAIGVALAALIARWMEGQLYGVALRADPSPPAPLPQTARERGDARAPFLIMHGTADPTVSFTEGMNFYNALRFNGKNAVMLAYPVTWRSTNPSIATVSSAGVVTSTATGTEVPRTGL